MVVAFVTKQYRLMFCAYKSENWLDFKVTKNLLAMYIKIQ